MGNVIQAPTIERHVITKQGEIEVTINLNLTITLDQQGGVKLTTSVGEKKTLLPDDDKVKKIVPEFSTSNNLLDFGKSV
jgi:acyl-CoA hydrolase